jgi:hypothetical protein
LFFFFFSFLPFYYDLWAFSSCSKTYCGYCNRAKQLLTQVGATYKVIELDELSKITVFFFFFLILLWLLVWSFVPVGICFFDENISFHFSYWFYNKKNKFLLHRIRMSKNLLFKRWWIRTSISTRPLDWAKYST